MEIFNNEDAIKYIKAKLNLDWCILEGDLSIISLIENEVRSEDFGIMLFGITPVVICKKTNMLKKVFNYPHGDFNDVRIITFAHGGNDDMSVKFTGCNAESKSDFVDDVIIKIKQLIVKVK